MNKSQSKPVLTAEEILKGKPHKETKSFGSAKYYHERIVLNVAEEYASQFEKQRGGLDEGVVDNIFADLLNRLEQSKDDYVIADVIRSIEKAKKEICQLSPKEDALRKEVKELKENNKNLKSRFEECHKELGLWKENHEKRVLTADQIAEALPIDEEINKQFPEDDSDPNSEYQDSCYAQRQAAKLMRKICIERLTGMIPAKVEKMSRDLLTDQFDKEPNEVSDRISYFAGYDLAFKTLSQNTPSEGGIKDKEFWKMQAEHHLSTIDNMGKVLFEITKCSRLHVAKEIALNKYKEYEYFKNKPSAPNHKQ